MTQIPIIVSRLNDHGLKEIFTLHHSGRDTISHPQTHAGQLHEFNTIDQSDRRNRKVRMKRIQSSGGKRKFPKDFFSRESNRSNNKNEQSHGNVRTLEHTLEKNLDVEASCEPRNEAYNIETPKFKQKYGEETQTYLVKNDATSNHNMNKKIHSSGHRIKIRSTKKINLQQRQTASAEPANSAGLLSSKKTSTNKEHKPMACFENTFSAKHFSQIPQWTCKPFQLNLLQQKMSYGEKHKCGRGVSMEKEKENIPMKKRSKVHNYKEAQIKKLTMVKDKIGYFNLRKDEV